MIETSSNRDKAIVAEVHRLRGVIISSYAHVEFLLGDLCMKAWQTAQYSHLRGKFPYSLEARVKSVRGLFSIDGPLRQYASEVDGVFERLSIFEAYRHFMAHGLCIVTPAATPLVHFRLWQTTKDGPEERTINLSVEQLKEKASEISEYCNQVISILSKVYTEQNLEIPAEAFSTADNPKPDAIPNSGTVGS